MARVSYDSKLLIPAPFVSISRSFNTADDGTILGSTYLIQVKGKMLPHRGSPTSSGTWHTTSGYPSDESEPTADECAGRLLRKTQALRALFQTPGRSFEIQSDDGSAPLRCNPRIKQVDIPDGLFFNVCEYNITLEADVMLGLYEPTVVGYLVRASEDWSLEPDELKRRFTLRHTLNAVGKTIYDSAGALTAEAWQHASGWVVPRLGLDSSKLNQAVVGAAGLEAYNYSRNVSTNVNAGAYSVTETFLGASESAIEDYTVSARTEADGKTSVSIEGQIAGLEERHTTTFALETTRYANAQTKWATVSPLLLTRAQSESGLTLNANQVSSSVQYNPIAGTISYTKAFDDRATNQIEGSITESVTVSDQLAAATVAQVPVLGRGARGPVKQDVGLATATERTISIEATVPCSRQGYTAVRPNADSIVSANYPTSYTSIYVKAHSEQWVASQGRFSKTVVLLYE